MSKLASAPFSVGVGEEDEFLVDEVREGDCFGVLLVQVQLCLVGLPSPLAVRHVVEQPVLPLCDLALGEAQFDRVVAGPAVVLEVDAVSLHVREVLLRLLHRRRAQTYSSRQNQFVTTLATLSVEAVCH